MVEVLNPDFDLKKAIQQTAEIGYAFAADAIREDACWALEAEVDLLDFEEDDHVDEPLNPHTGREVKQRHEKAYRPIGHEDVPIASSINESLVRSVGRLAYTYPVLENWHPTEAGYQLYRSTDDLISPHRDPKRHRILGFTITVNGSALVRVHEPVDNPDDYSNLRQIDEFRTGPGSVMLLRAAGLGNGERVIHEVMPPESGSRLILNLRMLPGVKNPSKET